MSASVDISEITAFVEGLKTSRREAANEARKVITKGALNIKNGAKTRLGKHASLPWLSRSITYDITSGEGLTEAEIGPDQAISGLGVGTEFGSVHHGPIPFLIPAFEDEAPKFEQSVEDAVAKAFGL